MGGDKILFSTDKLALKGADDLRRELNKVGENIRSSQSAIPKMGRGVVYLCNKQFKFVIIYVQSLSMPW